MTKYYPRQKVFPCWYCKHPDCRDETHTQGCPKLPPVTQAHMLEIAKSCERGWARGVPKRLVRSEVPRSNDASLAVLLLDGGISAG